MVNRKKYKQSCYNNVMNIDDGVLVYNSLTGAIIKMSISDYRQLCEMQISSDDVTLLLSEGFLVEANKDEYQSVKDTNTVTLDATKPLNIYWTIAPTLNCNFKCFYCFEGEILGSGNMTDAVSDAALKALEGTINHYRDSVRRFHVSWFGGEPLLEFDRVLNLSAKIKKLCKKYGVTFDSSIITNGLFLCKDAVDALANKCNITNIQITVDGVEREYCATKIATKDEYSRVLNNIVNCSKRIKTSIRFNYFKDNEDSIISQLNDLAQTEGINLDNLSVYLAPVRLDDKKRDQVIAATFPSAEKRFIDVCQTIKIKTSTKDNVLIQKASYCGMMQRQNVAIDCNGNIYRCERDMGRKELSIGNILYDEIFNLSESPYEHVVPDDKCRLCSVFPLCLGRCANDIVNRRQDFSYCPTIKKRVESAIINKYLLHAKKQRIAMVTRLNTSSEYGASSI